MGLRLTSLQTLNLSRCWQLSDLSPLAGLTSLQVLSLVGCEHLSDLSPPDWTQRMLPDDLRALTPLLYAHVAPYGTFRLGHEQAASH